MSRPNHQPMESTAQSMELGWDGKVEPTSPPSSELFTAYESTGNWPFDDNFANEIKYLINDTFDFKNDDLEPPQELMDGDDIVVELYDFKELKEENWSDAKLLALPTDLLDYQIGIVNQPNAIATAKVYNSNSSYGTLTAHQLLGTTASYENSAIFTQLTPPQSPPQSVVAAATSPALEAIKNINNNVNDLQQQPLANSHNSHHNHHQQHIVDASVSTSAALPHENFSAWDQGSHTPVAANDDIARDVQIVDDIVNIRANELLFNWQEEDECETQSSSSALSQEADSSIDEEWFPEYSSYSASVSSASSSPTRCGSSSAGDSVADAIPQSTVTTSRTAATAAQPKKRTRAYGGRGVEDRKIRKKEQNKNAATRYRQKKKAEMENVLSEEQTLAARNDELLKILADYKREQKYLKSLIREFYAPKGKK